MTTSFGVCQAVATFAQKRHTVFSEVNGFFKFLFLAFLGPKRGARFSAGLLLAEYMGLILEVEEA